MLGNDLVLATDSRVYRLQAVGHAGAQSSPGLAEWLNVLAGMLHRRGASLNRRGAHPPPAGLLVQNMGFLRLYEF